MEIEKIYSEEEFDLSNIDEDLLINDEDKKDINQTTISIEDKELESESEDEDIPEDNIDNNINDDTCNNISDDNSDSFNESNSQQNLKKEKIVLPKNLEYLVDFIRKYNQILMLADDNEFTKKAIQKSLKEEFIKVSENIAETFASEVIEKLDKENYFDDTKEYKKLQFIFNLDLDKEKEKLNIVEFDKEDFKSKILFDINEIYKLYGDLTDDKEYKEFFKDVLKIDVYAEDYFII